MLGRRANQTRPAAINGDGGILHGRVLQSGDLRRHEAPHPPLQPHDASRRRLRGRRRPRPPLLPPRRLPGPLERHRRRPRREGPPRRHLRHQGRRQVLGQGLSHGLRRGPGCGRCLQVGLRQPVRSSDLVGRIIRRYCVSYSLLSFCCRK